MATWQTRDGSLIEVVAMDDRHLVNAIHFIERVWRRRMIEDGYDAGHYSGGDLAMDAALGASIEAYDMAARLDPDDIADDFPAYPAMLDEAKKRRLLDHDYSASRYHNGA